MGLGGTVIVRAQAAGKELSLLGAVKVDFGVKAPVFGEQLVKELIESDFDPVKYVEENDLEQINDRELLSKLIDKAISENPKSVEDYKAGKQSALKAIIGKVMAQTGGKGNPVVINELMDEFASKL